jgi:hypothetical protein
LAHLAVANRHIAELTVEIVRQRVVVKHALDTGQRSEMAESLLSAGGAGARPDHSVNGRTWLTACKCLEYLLTELFQLDSLKRWLVAPDAIRLIETRGDHPVDGAPVANSAPRRAAE